MVVSLDELLAIMGIIIVKLNLILKHVAKKTISKKRSCIQ